MYASMRNAELCAILHQTHFGNAKKLVESRGLPGAGIALAKERWLRQNCVNLFATFDVKS